MLSATRWRRAFSSRWVDEDARFARRAGVTSPPFCDITLAHGATLDDPAFPVVWRSEAIAG